MNSWHKNYLKTEGAGSTRSFGLTSSLDSFGGFVLHAPLRLDPESW
jgi:hypothetical protein